MFDVWKNVLAELEQTIKSASFWLDRISFDLNEDTKVVTVGTINLFYQKQLSSKFDGNIKAALKNNGIEFSEIEYVVREDEPKAKIKAKEVNEGQPARVSAPTRINSDDSLLRGNFDSGLNSKYTMENFVIGSNNDLAVSVAQNIIDQPGVKYNPFFLYGGSGLGKTHLVQAIGNELLRKNPKMKILYTPVASFYSDFITSIKNKKGDEFNKKFRKLDVLIIDDFQGIIGKDRSQEEFFNIFNDLYQHNKQIIVTSDRLPSQIQSLDERLASRLTWAGAIDLQMPSFEDKCAILKSKAEWEGKEIEDEAIEYLAENVKTNIRDLESEFSRILLLSDLRKVSPLELINAGYVGTPKTSRPKTVTPKQLVERVAKYYQLSTKELCGKSRVKNIKDARQVAMYLLQEELNLSTPRIATEVGLKDHTTVLHGINRIKKEMKLNFSLRDQVEGIKEKIYG